MSDAMTASASLQRGTPATAWWRIAVCCAVLALPAGVDAADAPTPAPATSPAASPATAAQPAAGSVDAPAPSPEEQAAVAAWFNLLASGRPSLAAVSAQLDAHPELANAWNPIDPRAPRRYTALHLAAAHENRALCQLLIDRHASPDAERPGTSAPLFWCKPAMGRWLIAKGARPTIYWYAYAGDLEQVRALLAQHPDLVTARDLSGATALRHAVDAKAIPMVAELLSAGADANAVDDIGQSILDLAVGWDDAASRDPAQGEVVDLLVKRGARWDAPAAASHGDIAELAAALDRHPASAQARFTTFAGQGAMLIHLACAGNHQDCVELLLKRGSQIGALDDIGATPLHYAAAHGSTLVSWLLAHGADPHAVERRFNQEPRGWARFFRNKDALAIFDAVLSSQAKAKAAERESANF